MKKFLSSLQIDKALATTNFMLALGIERSSNFGTRILFALLMRNSMVLGWLK